MPLYREMKMALLPGNKLPDRNVWIGAICSLVSKFVMTWCGRHGYPIDADDQVSIVIVVYGVVAHLCDVATGDNRKS
jgi:hypothetical protein